jgi:hypothetical protein
MKWKGDDVFGSTGIQPFYTLTETRQLRPYLQDAPGGMEWVKTDFSEMYTRLPQDRVISGVVEAIKMGFDFAKERMSAEGIDTAEGIWLIVDSKEKYVDHTFTTKKEGLALEDCVEMLKVYIQNAFFKNREKADTNAEKLRIQSGGICIGGIASQQIANCYCANIEWRNALALIEKTATDLALKQYITTTCHGFKYVKRYVDDRKAQKECVPYLPSAADYGLTLGDSESGTSVRFIGYRVTSTANGVETEIADKQEVLAIEITRYPHANSSMSKATFIASYVSGLLRICEGTTDVSKIREPAKSFMRMLKDQRGYPFQWCSLGIRKLYSSMWVVNFSARNAIQRILQQAANDVYFPCTVITTGFPNGGNDCYLNVLLHSFSLMFAYAPRLYDAFSVTDVGSVIIAMLQAATSDRDLFKSLMDNLRKECNPREKQKKKKKKKGTKKCWGKNRGSFGPN